MNAARVLNALPDRLRETINVRSFSLLKIPLLFFCSPTVEELTDTRCVVRIPCNRRTRNHLKSLYFGALCVGADCAGGLIAMRAIQRRKAPVSLIFKDFHADFLKRAEGDTLFTCEDGEAILAAVERTMTSGERENLPVHITASVPSKTGDEPVARFTLTLSLKKKGA